VKRTIPVILALLGLLLLAWLLHRPSPAVRQSATNPVAASESPPSPSFPQTRLSKEPTNRTPEPGETFSNFSKAGITNWEEVAQQKQEAGLWEWKVPINFYGRVVDQSNEPVAGATANFTWNDLSPTGTSRDSTTSDGDGLFRLENRMGKGLSVSVSKEGYYTPTSEKIMSFEYAYPLGQAFKPDAGNPVVFHLRKKGHGEALIHGENLFGFDTNGTIRYLDLLAGKNTLTPPGDLAVQFTRGARNSDGKYDWSVGISVPDGGLLESDDEFMFEAPTDGYQPLIQIKMTADDPSWASGGKKKFFFQSRGGSIYGRAEATIYPRYQKGAAIALDYYVNPTGSRCLEPQQ